MDRQRRHGGRFAPSAAEAARLHDATGAPAETLTTLTWSIHHGDLPDWAQRIDSATATPGRYPALADGPLGAWS
ncbi:MAG TPA: hypothetical protein VJ820_14070 [Propionibacteriaceae bacterium]|nr:hypothetical protein [Propionibacteriaceae bacterium]